MYAIHLFSNKELHTPDLQVHQNVLQLSHIYSFDGHTPLKCL